MTRDEEIKAGLKDAGVPEYVIGTTLLKENQPTLREAVASGALSRLTKMTGVFIYPAKRNSPMQSRTAFYLVAKELFLSGTSVVCLPLSRLVEALTTDEMTLEANKVDQVRMVFVLDFYEDGAHFPLSPGDAARVRTWVRKMFESGRGVSFLSDSPLERSNAWWPQSFTGFISDNTISTPV